MSQYCSRFTKFPVFSTLSVLLLPACTDAETNLHIYKMKLIYHKFNFHSSQRYGIYVSAAVHKVIYCLQTEFTEHCQV